uniref:Gonadoliberin n=1 Tax=Chelydra serpentina TaxID=8475 RepID=A0A8C3S4D0_CHESE
MACQRPLLLLLFVVLVVSTHLSRAQHWSHGWYPGGKRELDLSQTPEVSSSLSLGGSSILLETPLRIRSLMKTLTYIERNVSSPLPSPVLTTQSTRPSETDQDPNCPEAQGSSDLHSWGTLADTTGKRRQLGEGQSWTAFSAFTC